MAAHLLRQRHLRTAQLRYSDANVDQVVEPGRTNKLQFDATHDEQHAKLLLELMLSKSEMPKPFRACSFQKTQVSAVIYDFAGIGVLKIHPNSD